MGLINWSDGCFIHLWKPVCNCRSFVFSINMNTKCFAVSNLGIYNLFFGNLSVSIHFIWCIAVETSFRRGFCFIVFFTSESKVIWCFVNVSGSKSTMQSFNPFSTNVPLLYPLKTSENLLFSGVFKGYRSGTLVENGLRYVLAS